jgi:hypothetical protein
MRRWWMIGMLCLATVCFSCSSKSNGGPNDPDGPDDPPVVPGTDLTVGDLETVDQSDVIVSSISLATTPDSLWAVAYYKDPNSTTACMNHETPSTVGTTSLYYARSNGSSWTPELVATSNTTNYLTASLSGVSLIFDQSDTPLIAYASGAMSGQCCMAGDLVQSSRNGSGVWTPQNLVRDSVDAPNQDANCPVDQNYCTFGDTVGLWPSQARAPNNTIGIAYQDIHRCWNKDDTDRADAEIVLGGNPEWIDIGRGGGYYNKLAFDSNSVPAVAFWNGKNGTIYFSKRGTTQWPWDVCTDTTQCQLGYTCDTTNGRCVIEVVKNVGGLPEGSLSLGIGWDGRYLLAYYNPSSDNLMLARSESSDGINWQSGSVATDGTTGMYPTILINQAAQKLAIIYYHCHDNENASNCSDDRDGVRLAVFTGVYPDELLTKSKWKKYTLESQLVKNVYDGKFVSAAIQSDGTIGVAYTYTWVVSGDVQKALVFRTVKIN